MQENKIVVHMKDGTIRKGITQSFDPRGESFYLLPAEGGGVPVKVRHDDMKAMFYVKDYMGNRDFVARRQFADAHREARRAILKFKDGEEIWGVLGEGADEDDPGVGFYFFPADKDDNNIRIFVIRSALVELKEVS